MRVLIPSYGRCGRVPALDYAERLTDDIVISVQTEEDRDRYESAYGGRARIAYRHGRNAAANRNTALMTLEDGQRALMLDDDCPRLHLCHGNGWRQSREVTADDLSAMFDRMERLGCQLGGVYPVSNPMYAHKSRPTGRNEMLIGAALMFVGGGLRFDETYDACEDYELCLRTIASGGGTLRFNRVICGGSGDTMKAGLTGGTKGGMSEAYAGGSHERAIRRLAMEYWPIAKVGRNGTSISIDKGVLGR